MNTFTADLIDKLDREDKEKILYFAKLLLKQEKYKKLLQEILERKDEIHARDVLEHEVFWKQLNV